MDLLSNLTGIIESTILGFVDLLKYIIENGIGVGAIFGGFAGFGWFYEFLERRKIINHINNLRIKYPRFLLTMKMDFLFKIINIKDTYIYLTEEIIYRIG